MFFLTFSVLWDDMHVLCLLIANENLEAQNDLILMVLLCFFRMIGHLLTIPKQELNHKFLYKTLLLETRLIFKNI